jgi:hypothetical protein
MSTKPTKEINVTFVHPRSSETFIADLTPNITSAQIIRNLIAEKFLESPTKTAGYVLIPKDSKKALAPNDSLEDAGVRDHDTIEIQATDVAGRACVPSAHVVRITIDVIVARAGISADNDYRAAPICKVTEARVIH